MSAATVEKRYTAEEYLELERKAETKSEYFNGRIFTMAGASREHNRITLNISSELNQQLKGRPCEVYSSEMRVKISDTGLYTYPDAVVACGDIQFDDAHVDILLNPVVIIEVLSPSTKAYDRGDAFAHYRRLPSLQEYVLIAQDRMRVERFVRQEANWILTEFSQPDDLLSFPSIDCSVALRDIYEKVNFPQHLQGEADQDTGQAVPSGESAAP